MLWKFVLRVAIAAVLIVGVIVGVNYFVDASQVITPRGQEQLAQLVLVLVEADLPHLQLYSLLLLLDRRLQRLRH